MEQIKKGDVVQLKSGSIKMNVEFVYNDFVKCMWFDSNGNIQEYNFWPHNLKLCNEDDNKSKN